MRKINEFCVLLTFGLLPFFVGLCLSQTTQPNPKKPASLPPTYLNEECGVSFEYPPTMVVVLIPSAETNKNQESDICSLSVESRRNTKGAQPIPAIHIVRGSLEKVAAGEGLIRDPDHPELWTFADGTTVGQGEEEKRSNWQGVHASYAARVFDEHGYYQGIGDAESLIACNAMDRCILFNTEDLGDRTFHLIRKTLRFVSPHE